MEPQLRILPERRLVMTLALRQSIEILQMPQTELAEWLLSESEKNPLLEIKRPPFTPMVLADREMEAPPSLHEHLRAQIRESFPHLKQLQIAESLLHQLDEKGYLEAEISKEQEEVLAVLQTFDPPGIFARNLQECLLIQLKMQNLTESPVFLLVRDFFSDLLQRRYAVLKKHFKTEDLTTGIQKLSQLSLRPASIFQSEIVPVVFPDLKIEYLDQQWKIEIPDGSLPQIQIKECPMDGLTAAEKIPVREWSTSAKWILRSVQRRKQILLQMGAYLVKKQGSYLNQKGKLIALTSQEMAQDLKVHPSTLSRALSGKYAETPRGIIPLRSLLSASAQTSSSKEILEQLISQEEKPLTDAELSERLLLKGIKIARRTIAKYRKELKIGSVRGRPYSSRSNAPK